MSHMSEGVMRAYLVISLTMNVITYVFLRRSWRRERRLHRLLLGIREHAC